MSSPEKLSKQALIEKCAAQSELLAQQDRTLQKLSTSLAQMIALTNDLGNTLTAMVDAFDANDRDAIAMQLRAMSDRKKEHRVEVH